MVNLVIVKGLKRCVGRGRCRFMTYGAFGRRFGLSKHTRSWANRTVLDAVATALKKDPKIKLDLTYLLSNGRTKYPSVMDGKSSKPPSPAQRRRAHQVAQRIINTFAPGTPNPY
jgi:hypothetical protein